MLLPLLLRRLDSSTAFVIVVVVLHSHYLARARRRRRRCGVLFVGFVRFLGISLGAVLDSAFLRDLLLEACS